MKLGPHSMCGDSTECGSFIVSLLSLSNIDMLFAVHLIMWIMKVQQVKNQKHKMEQGR